MLEFREITIEDRQWVQPLLDSAPCRALEYNFSFSYLWQHQLNYKIARYKDFFLLQATDSQERRSYLFPPGKGDLKEVIDVLFSYEHQQDNTLRFFMVPKEKLEYLEQEYPDLFEIQALEDYYDYVYEAQSLITLKGKKLSSKRNHINRFIEHYPDWQFEPITPENIGEVVAMEAEWKELYLEKSKSFLWESQSVDIALRNFFDLGLDGGLIRAQGKVVAFSMGDQVCDDTYLVHIEKAYREIQGAYPMINQQFATHFCQNYTYINREDASGNPGLIKAKQSYRPAFLVEKFAAFEK